MPKQKQLKLVAASVGAGAVVAMGALGVALGGSPETSGTFSEGPEATLGETSTETTGVTEPETTFATPPVVAEVPDGYSQEP
jgi:hypothetical protein